jgi:hypothetical protein
MRLRSIRMDPMPQSPTFMATVLPTDDAERGGTSSAICFLLAGVLLSKAFLVPSAELLCDLYCDRNFGQPIHEYCQAAETL